MQMMRPTRAQFPKYTNSSIFKIIRITQSKKWAGDINRCFPKKDLQMANRHVKRCSMLLIIREMQIRTTMKHHVTLVRMAIIQKFTSNECWRGHREREPSYTVDGNVKWCGHYGKQYGGSSKN